MCSSSTDSRRRTALAIAVIVVLIFSKYIYMASLSSYYTFYLIERFGVHEAGAEAQRGGERQRHVWQSQAERSSAEDRQP